jgi:hypothetical protein
MLKALKETPLASRASIQIFVCKEVLNTCCLNVASHGESLIKLESTWGQFSAEPVQVAMTAFYLSSTVGTRESLVWNLSNLKVKCHLISFKI